jgi:hypothetical protein
MKVRCHPLKSAVVLLVAAGMAIHSSNVMGQTTGDPVEPPAAAELPAAAAYYPLAVGNIWQFEMTTAGATQPIEFRAAKLETIDNVPMVRIDTIMASNVVVSESLVANDKGLFRYRYNGIEIAPPIMLLRNPVRVGDSWSAETEIGGQKVTVSCRVAEEKVSVKAGEFQTIKLAVETTADGVQIKSDYWLAADTGIVKQLLSIGGTVVEIELQKFVPASASAK